jgi:hypothetical protein
MILSFFDLLLFYISPGEEKLILPEKITLALNVS